MTAHVGCVNAPSEAADLSADFDSSLESVSDMTTRNGRPHRKGANPLHAAVARTVQWGVLHRTPMLGGQYIKEWMFDPAETPTPACTEPADLKRWLREENPARDLTAITVRCWWCSALPDGWHRRVRAGPLPATTRLC